MALSISGRPVPSNIPNVGAVKISRLERVDSAGNSVVALAETVVRSMQQISAPFWDYAFSVPPGQVNHEGYGVTLNEINRPYLTPMIDVTSGKSLRASFEFPVVARQLTNKELLDGFASSVDSEILLLQEFANYGIPIQFTNMHPALTTPAWYIDNITFNHSRIAVSGETAQAICSMSLIEFVPKTTRLILLPRFSYGKFTPITKKTKKDPKGPGVDDVERLTLTNSAARAVVGIKKNF
jgi:hypothetical protein